MSGHRVPKLLHIGNIFDAARFEVDLLSGSSDDSKGMIPSRNQRKSATAMVVGMSSELVAGRGSRCYQVIMTGKSKVAEMRPCQMATANRPDAATGVVVLFAFEQVS